ncbi:MAG: Hsp70 family protein [Porticoccaceae bacterium]|nr:Hsp70 family protein [Porticoccaceae bacterium]
MNKKSHSSCPKLGIGIDFGTSNSAAAIFDGQRVKLVKLSPYNPIMPSANYIDRDFKAEIGQEAIDEYIKGNQGRKVELSVEVLGEARTSAGGPDGPAGEGETSIVYGQAFNDGSLPGRLFRGTKRLLGNLASDRTLIFSRPFRLVALVTPILVGIRSALRDAISHFPDGKVQDLADHACIGHPVNFEGNEQQRNTVALERLSEAYRHAGITEQSFCPEPTAAAISFLHNQSYRQNQRLLTVDFGGGTLDFSILRRLDDSFKVEATHGIALGGDKIDQIIFRELVFPLLGKGERWSRVVDGLTVDTLFPFGDFEDLLINWPVSYMLNQNKYTAPVMQRMAEDDIAADKFKRLYDLIRQNYSYQVFEAIKDFKASLSVQQSAKLDIPQLDIEVELERWEFEVMISDALFELEQAITLILSKAELEATDIDLVLRTGGSSLIPAVKDILDNQFAGKVVEHDPFTSVAAGLAIADYYGYGQSQ